MPLTINPGEWSLLLSLLRCISCRSLSRFLASHTSASFKTCLTLYTVGNLFLFSDCWGASARTRSSLFSPLTPPPDDAIRDTTPTQDNLTGFSFSLSLSSCSSSSSLCVFQRRRWYMLHTSEAEGSEGHVLRDECRQTSLEKSFIKRYMAERVGPALHNSVSGVLLLFVRARCICSSIYVVTPSLRLRLFLELPSKTWCEITKSPGFSRLPRS